MVADVLLLLLLAGADPAGLGGRVVGRVVGLIPPRYDMARSGWWRRSSATGDAPPTPSTYSVFSVARSKGDRAGPLPAYSFATNSAGPKPPPGYHFSAGPKPARYPVRTTPPPPPPRPAEPVQSAARHRWRKPDEAAKGAATEKLSAAASCGSACPAYRLVSRSSRYEVRLYPAAVWASYVTATENRLLAEMEARAGIDEFRGGGNSLEVQLPRTYPFVTQLRFSPTQGATDQEGSDFTVSVPLLGDTALPQPNTNQLVLDSIQKQRVYVTSFWARPWKLTDRSLRMRTRRFSRRLRRHSETYLHDYFYLAKYQDTDSRLRIYYEIWLYSTPKKSRHRFRPMGKPLLGRRSTSRNNRTNDTRRRLCRGRECPRFEVLSEYKGGIQKRHYYNAAFATSKVAHCEFSLDDIWRSLMPLHLYRQGVNSHLEVIEPTRPTGVLRVWETEAAGNVSCHMTAMVYLPRRLHASPPNTGAHAPPIGLSYIHELTVYVQTVGGHQLTPGRLSDHVRRLRRRLDALGLCYRRGEYFVAVYDAVRRYHGRVNEVWAVARRCPSS